MKRDLNDKKSHTYGQPFCDSGSHHSNILCFISPLQTADSWVMCYLYGQQSVENTEEDLLVDIHSL